MKHQVSDDTLNIMLAIADATTSPITRLKRWLGLYKRKCHNCGKIDVPIPFHLGDQISPLGTAWTPELPYCGDGEQRNLCPHCLTVTKVARLKKRRLPVSIQLMR